MKEKILIRYFESYIILNYPPRKNAEELRFETLVCLCAQLSAVPRKFTETPFFFFSFLFSIKYTAVVIYSRISASSVSPELLYFAVEEVSILTRVFMRIQILTFRRLSDKHFIIDFSVEKMVKSC